MTDKVKQAIDVYNEIADEYAQSFDQDESDDPFLDRFLEEIERGGRILDLGCGTGRITNYFFEKGFEVVGLDAAEKMLQIARRKYPAITFLQGDMRKLDFPDASFDGVCFSYSFFHLDRVGADKALREAIRVLKKGGALLLILQEGSGEIMIDEPLKPGLQLPLKLYEEDEIRTLLAGVGGTIVSIQRKSSDLEGELPYNKMFVIAKT